MALLTRAIYFREHLESAFFGVPILDEKYYDTAARLLVSGGGSLETLDSGFRPWLYPFFLSVWYRLGGEWGDVLAIVVQHLLGCAIAVGVGALGYELFRSIGASLAAGFMYCLAGPPLFFEGELLITTLYTFLCLLVVLAAVRAEAEPSPGRWWLTGLLLGIGAQARANLLLYLVAFPVAWLSRRSEPEWRRGWPLVWLGLGALGPMLGFAAWQAEVSGRFQLIPGAGGVNFYLGNKAGADGMVPRQDWAVTYGAEYRDSVAVFAREGYEREHGTGEAASPAVVSRYWLRHTVDEIVDDPGRWLGLMARKAWFLAWSYEIPNNKSYAFIVEHESRWLRILPTRWWILLCLAPFGVYRALDKGRGRQLYWLGGFLILSAAGIVLFFVNSRYRIPLWPGMAVLAGGGLVHLASLVRGRRWKALAVSFFAGIGMFVLTFPSWLQVEPETPGRDFFFRSLAHLEKGNAAAAEADARQATRQMSRDPAAWLQHGNAAMALGEEAEARKSFLEAASLAPGEPRVFNNLAILDERSGRIAEAYRGYLHALDLAGDYAPALVNAALLELRAGLPERAAPRIERAAELGFSSLPMLGARALLAAARGDEAAVGEHLSRAGQIDAEALERFLELHRQRLEPEDLGISPPEPTPPDGLSGRPERL